MIFGVQNDISGVVHPDFSAVFTKKNDPAEEGSF